MNLKVVSSKDVGRNTADAPCGGKVRVPIGARVWTVLHCEACGDEHTLTRTRHGGKPAKLA